jgi:hypothetical protein
MNACKSAISQEEASCPDVIALEKLWQKLDEQIRQTHTNLERLIGAKIRIEQELSGAQQSIATDQRQVTAEELEHFQAVTREATRNFFQDRLNKVRCACS